MRRDDLNLEEFPDSPYAASLLDAADRALHFPPELEAEFRAFQLENTRSTVRSWLLVTLCILVVEAIRRLAGLAYPSSAPSTLTLWCLLIPFCAAATLVTWTERYTAWYRPVARVVFPVIVMVFSLDVAGMLAQGYVIGVAGVAVAVLGGYLLVGALFMEGAALSAVAIVGLVTGGLMTSGPTAGYWVWAGLSGCLAIVGAIASYTFETTSRRHFLESGLLREMAWRDGLTGLKNRRAFDEHLGSVWIQGIRDRHTVGLLLVDIDHFKAYNDACGHQQGDACLRRIGNVLEGFARRPLDMVARYGGEELVVVLYQMTSERTQDIAEDLRRAVERLRIGHPQSPTSPFVTVSVGAACVRPIADRSPEGLIQLADEALYAAKHDTRNCVRFQQAEYATLSTGNFRRPRDRMEGSEAVARGRAAR